MISSLASSGVIRSRALSTVILVTVFYFLYFFLHCFEFFFPCGVLCYAVSEAAYVFIQRLDVWAAFHFNLAPRYRLLLPLFFSAVVYTLLSYLCARL